MPSASIAASVSAQGATGDGDTVTMPVSSERQESEGLNVSRDTSATTKRIATVTRCEHCGREFVARRPWARYCNPYCRRRAWLQRNPDKAAELAAKDKARLRTHFEAAGKTWVDKVTQ
jgi:hypothetical protein